MRTNRLPIIGGFIVVLSIIASVLFITPQLAYAGGAVGGGGGSSGGGCCGGPHTNYGYGWYRFDANGSGPGDFKSGNWGSVSQKCRDTDNDSVVAFIVQRSSGGPSNARVYNYVSGSFGTYYKYLGNSGGRWLSYGTASNLFYNIPYSIRAGYSFGSNLAWFCYSFRSHWIGQGASYVKKDSSSMDVNSDDGWTAGNIVAAPKDVLYFKHTLTNTNATTDQRVDWSLVGTGFPSTFVINNKGFKAAGLAKNVLFASLGQYPGGNAASTVYKVTQKDVTSTLCQNIRWVPNAWNGSGALTSTARCASIPYNYTLTPQMSNDIVGTVAAGTTIESVNGSIENSGPTKSKDTTIWQMSQIIVAPGQAVPSGGSSPIAPCGANNEGQYKGNYFGSSPKCTNLVRGAGVITTTGTTLSKSSILVDESLPIGTKVCYALSVREHSSSDANWQHSELKCKTISKRPKVQIHGGDLSVGKSFVGLSPALSTVTTSTTTKSTASSTFTFGSWIEYGIFATGSIRGTGSGSAFAGVGLQGLTNGSPCAYSKLSFANLPPETSSCTDTTTVGGYANSRKIPDIAGNFPVTTATPIFDNNNPSPQGVYRADDSSTTINLSARNIAKGQWVVINAQDGNGKYTDVRITGNITYDGSSLQSITDIPQLVIIAKNIYINDTVTNVDSWLIARGSSTANTGIIDTCAISTDYTTPLSVNICASQLQVNGPVMAQELWLRRTYGSTGTGAASGDPAEIFNFRPDAYLWAASRSLLTGGIQTVYSKQLPPRF